MYIQCPHSPVVCEASVTGLQVGVAFRAPLTSAPVERGGRGRRRKGGRETDINMCTHCTCTQNDHTSVLNDRQHSHTDFET